MDSSSKKPGMRVTTYGTRGSIPVAGRECAEFGGNTTCLRIQSACIPASMAFVIDSGSGYRKCGVDILRAVIKKVGLLQTHWHWDHIQGFPFGPHIYVPGCFTQIWGPKEHGIGPQEVMDRQMQEPFFPMSFAKVKHQIHCKPLENIGTQVLVLHPTGGVKLEMVNTFRQRDKENGQVSFTANPFGQAGSYTIKECLVVWMYKTVHPEYTVSYRFEERPTGKVFVFLTDHEVTAGWAADLLVHLKDADLLIQDCQYSDEAYESKVGWGHGTPAYCAQTAIKAGVRQLGLTHHEPGASDGDIAKRLDEARTELLRAKRPDLAEATFVCKDYAVIEV